MSIRDHSIFKVVIRGTVDVRQPDGSGDGGMYKVAESREDFTEPVQD